MADILQSLGPWSWLVLGLMLMGLELVAPGVFLIWLGLAAILTGLLDAAIGLSWQTAALIFSALAVITVIVGRRVTRSRSEDEASRPLLNRRGYALVGRVFILESPIIEGNGRIRVDDTFWRVTGGDAPAGTRVRAVGIDGATLTVEPAEAPPASSLR